MVEKRYLTTDTPLAAYLIQAGHSLLEIIYEQKPNGRQQATFAFFTTTKLQSHVDLFNSGSAIINLALYEHAKNSLLDRIMRGMQ